MWSSSLAEEIGSMFEGYGWREHDVERALERFVAQRTASRATGKAVPAMPPEVKKVKHRQSARESMRRVHARRREQLQAVRALGHFLPNNPHKPHRCGLCGQVGHNRRTHPQEARP